MADVIKGHVSFNKIMWLTTGIWPTKCKPYWCGFDSFVWRFFLSDFIAHASKRTGNSKGAAIDIVGKDWTIARFIFFYSRYKIIFNVKLEMHMIYGASVIFE